MGVTVQGANPWFPTNYHIFCYIFKPFDNVANFMIKKKILNNIIKPRIGDFVDRYAKSLEEFGIDGEFTDMVELYYYIKQKMPKLRYRLSLEQTETRFCSCFSYNI